MKIKGFLFYILILIPSIALFITGVLLIITMFSSPDNDTTHLTNGGFAILAALGSMCFAWSRALDKDKDDNIEEIVVLGERFFSASLLFIIASASKYFLIYIENWEKESAFQLMDFVKVIVYGILGPTQGAVFGVAILMGVRSTINLNILLLRRRFEQDDKEAKKEKLEPESIADKVLEPLKTKL